MKGRRDTWEDANTAVRSLEERGLGKGSVKQSADIKIGIKKTQE